MCDTMSEGIRMPLRMGREIRVATVDLTEQGLAEIKKRKGI